MGYIDKTPRAYLLFRRPEEASETRGKRLKIVFRMDLDSQLERMKFEWLVTCLW